MPPPADRAAVVAPRARRQNEQTSLQIAAVGLREIRWRSHEVRALSREQIHPQLLDGGRQWSDCVLSGVDAANAPNRGEDKTLDRRGCERCAFGAEGVLPLQNLLRLWDERRLSDVVRALPLDLLLFKGLPDCGLACAQASLQEIDQQDVGHLQHARVNVVVGFVGWSSKTYAYPIDIVMWLSGNHPCTVQPGRSGTRVVPIWVD